MSVSEPPVLDGRDRDALLKQLQTLAQAYVPEAPGLWDGRRGAGAAILELFADLGIDVIDAVNGIPEQRALAFLRFLEQSPAPPSAANTNLTFEIARDAEAPVIIPKGSFVSAEGDQQIRFATQVSLQAMPLSLETILSVLPQQDAYADHTEAEGPIQPFPNASAVTPLPHALLIADPSLFAPSDGDVSLQIELEGEQLAPRYFSQWASGDGTLLAASLRSSDDQRKLQFNLAGPTAPAGSLEATCAAIFGARAAIGHNDEADSQDEDLSDLEGEEPLPFWLAVQPDPAARILSADASLLPLLTDVTVVRCVKQLPCDQAIAGDTVLDLRNGGAPFGDRPAVEDAIYFGSADALSHPGAKVRLNLSCRHLSPPPDVILAPELRWEFWDGQTWAAMNDSYVFEDHSNSLMGTSDGSASYVSFTCPKIVATEVAGIEGYWLRCRLSSGGYGHGLTFKTFDVDQVIDDVPGIPSGDKAKIIKHLMGEGINFGYEVGEPRFYPPFILSALFDYRITAAPKTMERFNSFSSAPLADRPYRAAQGDGPCLYLGFSGGSALFPQSDAFELALDFPQAPILHSLDRTTVWEPAPPSEVTWSVRDGDVWRELDVEDGTKGLTRSGRVLIRLPGVLPEQTALFGQTRLWLRATLCGATSDARLQGIHVNAVPASNDQVLADEDAGSGSGTPNQAIEVLETPVLEGQRVEIVERPDQDARVAWQEVQGFALSGPQDRHYTLDRERGIVRFGDGVRGRVVPAGRDNIMLVDWRSCDAAFGNVAANTLTELDSAGSDVLAVTNPQAAFGGLDVEPTPSLQDRAPSALAARGRGILLRDLEPLAFAASPDVLAASAVSGPNGAIQLFVLGVSASKPPVPTQRCLDLVERAVSAAMPPQMAARLRVRGPDFRTVDVSVEFVRRPGADPAEARARLAAQIRSVLKPSRFGATLAPEVLAATLAKDNDVARVGRVAFDGKTEALTLSPSWVPYLGKVSLFAVNSV